MIAVVLAVFAAASNAVASVLQRLAARRVPERVAMRLGLIWALLRSPVWFGGIGALILGFAFQAAALSQGGLALVQPVLISELPFTMILVSRVFGIRLGGRSWLAIGLLTGGLALLLFAASPRPGDGGPDVLGWVMATAGTLATVCALVLVARVTVGAGRAVAFGVAAGVGFAFTATFIKQATMVLEEDVSVLPVTWQVYAMVVAGLCSLFLLQNALQSGTLVAAQPALTLSDPVASIVYGTTMFGEEIRTGVWILPELTGIALMVCGSCLLAQSAWFIGTPQATPVDTPY
ncbi:DMT family transporter [Sphaerisporangium aureirubrum]|uniref:DMT family transporter n=1 Tax=Sphaerisporangium aureirubrum TaxID=1544736 RepID=A0ABW1NHU1_9ACTN